MIINRKNLETLSMKKEIKKVEPIEKAIAEIKERIEDFAATYHKGNLAQELGLQVNYFHDLKRKKNFTITELSALSKKFNYNLFNHIDMQQRGAKREELPQISITIEVKDIEKNRIILEQIMDKNSASKLLG